MAGMKGLSSLCKVILKALALWDKLQGCGRRVENAQFEFLKHIGLHGVFQNVLSASGILFCPPPSGANRKG